MNTYLQSFRTHKRGTHGAINEFLATYLQGGGVNNVLDLPHNCAMALEFNRTYPEIDVHWFGVEWDLDLARKFECNRPSNMTWIISEVWNLLKPHQRVHHLRDPISGNWQPVCLPKFHGFYLDTCTGPRVEAFRALENLGNKIAPDVDVAPVIITMAMRGMQRKAMMELALAPKLDAEDPGYYPCGNKKEYSDGALRIMGKVAHCLDSCNGWTYDHHSERTYSSNPAGTGTPMMQMQGLLVRT